GLAVMNDKAAAAAPFAKTAGLLGDLAGGRLTAKRGERAAEASGAPQGAAPPRRAPPSTPRQPIPPPPGPPPDQPYAPPHPAAAGPGGPMTAKGTPGGAGRGEGARPRPRGVSLASFFTQDKLNEAGCPVRAPGSSSYIAPSDPAAVFADLVKAESTRRGADHV